MIGLSITWTHARPLEKIANENLSLPLSLRISYRFPPIPSKKGQETAESIFQGCCKDSGRRGTAVWNSVCGATKSTSRIDPWYLVTEVAVLLIVSHHRARDKRSHFLQYWGKWSRCKKLIIIVCLYQLLLSCYLESP